MHLIHEGDQGQGAVRLVSYLHSNKATTNLGPALVNNFSLNCRSIGPEDVLTPQPEVRQPAESDEHKQAEVKRKTTPPCSEAGICLCSDSGCRVWQLLCKFINAIKLAFPSSGSNRTSLLTKSHIFALIEGCPQATAETEGFSGQIVELWHIGIQYLTPFRPTFRDCTILETHAADQIEVEAWLTSSQAAKLVGWSFWGFRGVLPGRMRVALAWGS